MRRLPVIVLTVLAAAPLAAQDTTVTKDQTARTVAANNVVNCASMSLGAVGVILLTSAGLGPVDLLLLVAGMCLISAWLAWRLHRACEDVCAKH